MAIIALTTDFGTRDHYVASMKGVILGIAPSVTIVDVTHEIEPHDVAQAAFVLRQVWSHFPPGTIHVVVVDPGVGTSRRILLGSYAGRWAVAPDNGLMTFVHRDFSPDAMYVVENRRYFGGDVSATFHGRDIMAPLAAHLAEGVKPRDVGRVPDRIELLSVPYRAGVETEGIRGIVLYVDRFGTLVTNIAADQLAALDESAEPARVTIDGTSIGKIRLTFADVPPGDPVALVGGSGLLEIAVNRGRAVDRFGRDVAVRVEV